MPVDADPAGILALIPAYNEADRVAGVVAAARRYLPVLVIDDGSSDETAARAVAAGAQALSQTPNQGKGVALKAGFRRALDQGYKAVITLDADGQHDPDEIPKFLAAFQAHQADLIVGARSFAHMPAVRRFANSFGRWSFSWAVGQPIQDNQSGFRLVSRRLMAAMLNSGERGFEFEVAMILTCVRQGYRLAWVPIRTIYAGERSHIQPIKHTLGFFRLLWWARRQRVRSAFGRLE